jgi:hypothetical protein
MDPRIREGDEYGGGLAKRRALFPEGRGLGVGGRKERKKKAKEKRKRPTQRSGMGLKALRRGLGVGGRKRM